MPRHSRRSLTERLVRRVYYKYFARNLLFELQIRARSEAADYVQAKMPGALIFERHADLLRYAVAQAGPHGLFLEFGVAGGNSIRIIAGATNSVVHGFDSFEGLPSDWAGHVERRGSFSQSKLPRVQNNVRLHRGWFADTIPVFKQRHSGPVSFIHMDCDIYDSTRDVLDGFADEIVAGTVILFDEYFNYPGWRLHEYKAWQAFVTERELAYDYLAISALEGRVVVKVK